MNVFTINNFLPYPNVVREWAIKQKFYNSKEFTEKHNSFTDWPGLRTEHIVDLDKNYADIILTQISNIATRVYGLQNISIKSYFQLTRKSDGDSWVHQDNNVQLAAILYLNPYAPINSGTTLYNCKNVYKWQSYMSSNEGYNILKTINTIDNIELYNELFEPIDIIGNVFNRLVFYSGLTYHKSNNYFGDNIENGRLTQVFFIQQDT